MLLRVGRSIRWLAGRIGTSPQNLHNWLKGESRPRNDDVWSEMLQILLAEDQATPTHLKSARTVTMQRASTSHIPIYGAIQCGQPAMSTSQIVDWLDIPDWGGDFNRWGRIVQGSSMEPELIEGDIAIFEDRRFEWGQCVYAFKDGEDTIKVARKIGGTPHLAPTNPDFDPFVAEGWNVKGVLIMRKRYGERGIVDTREYPHGFRPHF